MTINITPEKRITLLKHLAGGKPSTVVASLMSMDEADVVSIASNHGYPALNKMSWAVDVLTEKLQKEQAAPERPLARGEGTTPRTIPARAEAAAPVSAPPSQTQLTKPDEIRVLLNTAKDHPAKRIQTAANKVFDDIAKLQQLIADDQEKNAERRRLEAEKAAARAEVKRLEQQLATAKAKLKGTPASKTVTTSEGPAPSDIRAWAREKGLDVPSRGQLPKSISEAYDEAHAQAS